MASRIASRMASRFASRMESRMASFDEEMLMQTMNKAMMASMAEYPSKWFEKNPGKKPRVELPVMECTLDQVRTTVRHFLLNNRKHRLNRDLVLLYFRKLADEMQVRLDADWTSFGITVGKAGSEVSPLDLVDVKDHTVKLNLKQEVTASPEDDVWILMALATVFYQSVCSGSVSDTIGASPKVLEAGKTAGVKASQLKRFQIDNQALAKVTSYRMMIAVFDMFLFRFPDHKLYAARNLTSVSRFHECPAFQSFSRLSELINRNFREIKQYLWTIQLQKEFFELYEPGNEMEQPYSYAPYFMVLGLSRGSPYFESHAYPNLYVFINIVRAIMGDQDARRARIPEETVIPNVTINALIFAYTLEPGDERLEGLPEGDNFAEWFKWFAMNHSTYVYSYLKMRPPKALIEKLQHTWSAFGQDPPGTIGNMLYELKP